ncbi:MAG TPA: DNA primase [Methylovirgula sp.]|nr:DNA primase [Methylovirgula sp.]
MRFPPSFLDELKARLPVSDVVRKRVKLTKAGREWRGLSPFNAERTPSFFVNDQKMAWFDHSAGKNGNIFDFLMETEGLSFPEAVTRLAEQAGLALPQMSPEAEAREKQRASLYDVLELAANYFAAELVGRSGAKARAYLADRGLNGTLQAEFRLGYAGPEKYALRDHLAGKGISAQAMIETGLLIHGEDIAVPYDRFRDRVMFPIADRAGRVIAFGGRALGPDVQPKYLNSPETPLFHKGAILYNHHKARKAAHERGSVIAVEGYVDAISMSAAGFPHTVAPLGTALTADQCELLWKMAEEPVLCFDGDRAGRKAAYRAVDLALPLIGVGRSLRFALLPDGQDPDDLARSGGTAAIDDVLGAALPLVDLVWQRETEAQVLTTPERRAGLERRLENICGEIRDEALRRHYSAEFRNRLAALFGQASPAAGQRFAVQSARYRGAPRRGAEGPQTYVFQPAPVLGASLARSLLLRPKRAGIPGREAFILLIFLNHPNLLDAHGETLAELELSSSEAQTLRRKLLDLWADRRLASRDLKAEIERCGLGAVRQRLEAMTAHSSLWSVSAEAADPDAEESLKQALALHRKMRALNRELVLAEAALAGDSSETNLTWLKSIQEQLSALAGTEAVIEGFGAASGRQSGAL